MLVRHRDLSNKPCSLSLDAMCMYLIGVAEFVSACLSEVKPPLSGGRRLISLVRLEKKYDGPIDLAV